MLQLRHISRSFPGVKALQDVSMQFNKGEVHALCGENGAGKSTLMNILVGNLQPDSGDIFFNHKKTRIENVQTAQQLGIGIVYQERSLADALTVAENIYPVNQPLNRFGLIDHKQLYQQTQVLLDELQLTDLSPSTKIGRLSSAQKQMVEIAKALAQDPSFLILDEPTASITSTETAILFSVIRQLKAKGVAIIYISHRMAEIKEIADMISVLKDGVLQGTFTTGAVSTETIISKMVGRVLLQAEYVSQLQSQPVLEVKKLSGRGFYNVSFTLHKGEILGLAGLQGSGRTALALGIFGDIDIESGEVLVNNFIAGIHHPADAIRQHIAYIPDERKTQGLFLEQSISDNVIAARLEKGLYDRDANNTVAEKYKSLLNIRATGVGQQVQKLSGGNQQKVVLAKWLHINASVFMINEPTHGVDVGAKAEIYKELQKLTNAGKSILLISSELPELLLLSDRIAVMHRGRLRGFLNRQDATEENITLMASGM